MIDSHRNSVGSSRAQHYGGFLFAALYLAMSVCVADVGSRESIKSDPRYQNPALLEQAWALPVAKQYRASFEYQVNPMFCGPATAVNVLKSLGIKKYQQSNVFDSSSISYFKALAAGLTLDEMATLVHDASGWKVTALHDLTLAQFREHLKRSNDPTQRYTINFHRKPLWGYSAGHHSPIGGYLEKEDLVFVLDVYDPFKPFLVSSERLFEAMNTVDDEAGKTRGLLLITH
jgi:hypothetical protein